MGWLDREHGPAAVPRAQPHSGQMASHATSTTPYGGERSSSSAPSGVEVPPSLSEMHRLLGWTAQDNAQHARQRDRRRRRRRAAQARRRAVNSGAMSMAYNQAALSSSLPVLTRPGPIGGDSGVVHSFPSAASSTTATLGSAATAYELPYAADPRVGVLLGGRRGGAAWARSPPLLQSRSQLVKSAGRLPSSMTAQQQQLQQQQQQHVEAEDGGNLPTELLFQQHMRASSAAAAAQAPRQSHAGGGGGGGDGGGVGGMRSNTLLHSLRRGQSGSSLRHNDGDEYVLTGPTAQVQLWRPGVDGQTADAGTHDDHHHGLSRSPSPTTHTTSGPPTMIINPAVQPLESAPLQVRPGGTSVLPGGNSGGTRRRKRTSHTRKPRRGEKQKKQATRPRSHSRPRSRSRSRSPSHGVGRGGTNGAPSGMTVPHGSQRPRASLDRPARPYEKSWQVKRQAKRRRSWPRPGLVAERRQQLRHLEFSLAQRAKLRALVRVVVVLWVVWVGCGGVGVLFLRRELDGASWGCFQTAL